MSEDRSSVANAKTTTMINSSARKRQRFKVDEGKIDDTLLRIHSLKDLPIQFAPDIIQHLASQHKNDKDYTNRLVNAMKRSVSTTVCRVNLIRAKRSDVLVELKIILSSIPTLTVQESSLFQDVIEIKASQQDYRPPDLSTCTRPISQGAFDETDNLFTNWPTRKEKGWPMTHRAVLCDRFCGEAVLRGSDIFVRGILAADCGIKPGEKVAVYADIPVMANGMSAPKKIARGMMLEKYRGCCVFLGLGTMKCSRGEIFKQTNGVAVSMSLDPAERVGPLLPPLSGVLVDKLMLQNLPSILVAHALNPQPGDVILDMCAAPGGKTAHLASLVKNQAIIVATDRSRKKMVAAKKMFERLGASCITPLALDSTRCVDSESAAAASVAQLIKQATPSPEDGLKNIQHFSPESFDKILLDPPCSALGLRPKLAVTQQNLRQLDKHASYQRKFVKQAVSLLKQGGFMTYSTCTMNSTENESVVKHILQDYPSMELIPLKVPEIKERCFGGPGGQGVGLNEEQRLMVRRFDPGDSEEDTMGFFVALFRKRAATI